PVEGNAPAFRSLGEQLRDLAQQDVWLDALQAQTELPRLDARQIEQIFHQLVESGGIAIDDVEEASRHVRSALQRSLQRFRRRADGGDGGAQLVRDVGDELTTNVLEAARLRHVHEHGQ